MAKFNLLKKIFSGSGEPRVSKKFKENVQAINQLESEMEKLSDYQLSAKTGENADWLIREVEELLAFERTVVTLKLSYAEGKGIAWLYRNAEVLERKDLPNCAEFRVLMFSQELERFQKNFNNL